MIFLLKLILMLKLLLSVGMDGRKVNFTFKRLLLEDLRKNFATTLIYLGTYPLHTANNAFGKFVQVLKEVVNLDQM